MSYPDGEPSLVRRFLVAGLVLSLVTPSAQAAECQWISYGDLAGDATMEPLSRGNIYADELDIVEVKFAGDGSRMAVAIANLHPPAALLDPKNYYDIGFDAAGKHRWFRIQVSQNGHVRATLYTYEEFPQPWGTEPAEVETVWGELGTLTVTVPESLDLSAEDPLLATRVSTWGTHSIPATGYVLAEYYDEAPDDGPRDIELIGC